MTRQIYIAYDYKKGMKKMQTFPTMRSELHHVVPTMSRYFDVQLRNDHVVIKKSPFQSVFMALGHSTSNTLDKLLANNASLFSAHPILVVASSDRRITTAKHFGLDIAKLVNSKVFRQVYWEAMNKPVTGVRPVPMLFVDRYLKAAMVQTWPNPIPKTKWLHAAWGAFQPQLDKSPSVPDRKLAREWVGKMSDVSWVDTKLRSPKEYWGNLSSFRFTLAPSGLGVQSSKAYESLAHFSIPIVHESNVAYTMLREEGWPFVVVKTWDEITYEKLKAWWTLLSTELEATRACMQANVFYSTLVRRETMNTCKKKMKVRLRGREQFSSSMW